MIFRLLGPRDAPSLLRPCAWNSRGKLSCLRDFWICFVLMRLLGLSGSTPSTRRHIGLFLGRGDQIEAKSSKALSNLGYRGSYLQHGNVQQFGRARYSQLLSVYQQHTLQGLKTGFLPRPARVRFFTSASEIDPCDQGSVVASQLNPNSVESWSTQTFRGYRWTHEEDEILRSNFNESPHTFGSRLYEIASKVNLHLKSLGESHERTACAVEKRLRRLRQPRNTLLENVKSTDPQGRLLVCGGDRILPKSCEPTVRKLETRLNREQGKEVISERMQKIIQEVLHDKTLMDDLEGSHETWPAAIDQIIIRAGQEKLPISIIAAMLPGRRRYHYNTVSTRWYKFLKQGQVPPLSIRWTSQEDDFVKQNLREGRSYQWIADHKPPPYRAAHMIAERHKTVWKMDIGGISTPKPCVFKFWTDDEFDILRKGRELGKSFAEIQQDLPHRSIKALQKKAKCTNRCSSRKLWTIQEVQLLKHGQEMGRSWEEIAQELPGRSTGSLRSKWALIVLRELT